MMSTPWGLIIFLVVVLVNVVFALIMNNVALQKGHENSHAFVIVLIFGVLGCLYVIALPDMIQRKQNEDILTILLEIKGKE